MSKPFRRGDKWRITEYDYTDENGKQHNKTFTADTKVEVQLMAAEFKAKKDLRKKSGRGLTVRQAIDRYIDISEVLSPTTLHVYRRIQQYAFKTIMDSKVDNLDDEDMQRAINIEAKRITTQTHKQISPKTVKNEWSLISAALKLVCKKQYIVKLPPIKGSQKNKMLPELDDLLAATVGTIIELPMYLAGKHSLRMSEIRGLTCKSLVGDELFVNQVMVQVGNQDVIKEIAKTRKSNRSVIIYDRVRNLIVNSEPYQAYLKDGVDRLLVPMTRHKIYYHFEKAIKNAGISISFHDLRAVFASLMLTQIGSPGRIVQGEGGWETDYTINTHYSREFESVRRAETKKLDDLFEESLHRVLHQEAETP